MIVNGIDMRSGKNGTVLFGATEYLPVESWSFDDTTGSVPFANSKSGNTVVEAETFLNSDGTIAFDIDYLQNPLKAPVNIRAGVHLTNIKLLLDRSTTFGWYGYDMLIKSNGTRCTVNGKAAMSFRFHMNAYDVLS